MKPTHLTYLGQGSKEETPTWQAVPAGSMLFLFRIGRPKPASAVSLMAGKISSELVILICSVRKKKSVILL